MQSMLLVLIVTFAVSGDAQNISAQPPLDPPVLQSTFLSASSPTELPLHLQETRGTVEPNFLSVSPTEGPLHPEMCDTPQPKVPGLAHADGTPTTSTKDVHQPPQDQYFGPTSTGNASVSKV